MNFEGFNGPCLTKKKKGKNTSREKKKILTILVVEKEDKGMT
jgi:hypothetical protein